MLGMQARTVTAKTSLEARLELLPISRPIQGSRPEISLTGNLRQGNLLTGNLRPVILRPADWPNSVRLFMSIMRLASIVLLAYWALIFFGTHIPKASMPSLNASDKVYHCGAFMGLSFLLCWAIPSSRFSLGKILILTASIALVYAVLDEWTQQFIPGRTCDIWDVAADSVGVALGLLAYVIARPLVRRLKWAQRLLAPNA